MRRLIPALLLPLALVACDKTSTEPEQEGMVGSMSRAEVLSALRALQALQQGSSTPTRSAEAFGEAAVAFSTSCPGGGRYELSGEYGASDSAFITLYDLRERFSKCVVSNEGRTYTFDSDPELRSRVGLTIVDRLTWKLRMTGSYTGGFVVTSDGKTARCTVSITTSADIDDPTAGTTEGQLCGRDLLAADGGGIILGPGNFITR